MEGIVHNQNDFRLYADEMLSASFPDANVCIMEAMRNAGGYLLRVGINDFTATILADTGYEAVCGIEEKYEYYIKSK